MQKLFQFLMFGWILITIGSGCSSTTSFETPDFAPSPNSEHAAIEGGGTFPPVPPSPTMVISPTPTVPLVETIPPDPPGKTVIAFTGVIVPARCVQEEINRRGSADYIYDEVREIISSADIAVGVFNATMRDSIEYMGCVKSWELVGSSNNADALARAGFDIMSLATNHIKDCGFFFCGDDGFFSTLEHFSRVNIQTVGAGETLAQSLEPVVVSVNGFRFGFVSLGEVNERVFADNSKPGIAYLSLRNLEGAIERAKEVADVVIVLPHSGPEDYPEVTPQQKYWARYSVEYGADLVVMTHAHILQGHHKIEGVPVFYSLGNFVFDQSWARDHQQGAILVVEFVGDEISSFQLLPTVVEQDGTVHLADEEERAVILERVEDLAEALLP